MAFLVAFLVALSGGVWVYTKLNQRTGYGDNPAAVKGAIAAAVGIFVVVLTIGFLAFK